MQMYYLVLHSRFMPCVFQCSDSVCSNADMTSALLHSAFTMVRLVGYLLGRSVRSIDRLYLFLLSVENLSVPWYCCTRSVFQIYLLYFKCSGLGPGSAAHACRTPAHSSQEECLSLPLADQSARLQAAQRVEHQREEAPSGWAGQVGRCD